MIVIAVLHLDIHPRLGHPSGDLTELTGLALAQALDEDIPHGNDADACGCEDLARLLAVLEEKVCDSHAAGEEDSATFDAHPGPAQGLAHVGERARPVLQLDGQILHR